MLQTQAAIVPNTAPASGQLLIGNAGGTAYAPLSLSQDCTLASTGVITCAKSNNVAFSTAAFVNTGSSGATIPLLNVANTWSAKQTYTAALALALAPAAGNCTGSALSNCGTLSIGGGPFDGTTTGKFVGAVSGTSIAVNEVSGYVGNLLDLQIAGVYKVTITNTGSLALTGDILFPGQLVLSRLSPTGAPGDSLGAGYFNPGDRGFFGSYYLFQGAATVADAGFSRDSAGVIDVGTGALTSTAGSMKMTGLTLVGQSANAGTIACYKTGGVLGYATIVAGAITVCN
jgi:hypothetical protein